MEEILPGDIIRTRKTHPCGSDEWTVIRTGADIRIRCNRCGRLVMMDRDTFLKRKKALISRQTLSGSVSQPHVRKQTCQ